jgi:uncharacterized protein (TIGR02246 family)
MTDRDDVIALYEALLRSWNDRDAGRWGSLFTVDGSMVGFDGSAIEMRAAMIEHLEEIFADHTPAMYVAKVREVRMLADDVMLLRAVAGMNPPGSSEIKGEVNAVQVLVARRTDAGGDAHWRIAHFQNTPARFDGRPDAARALTAELQEVRDACAIVGTEPA